MIRWANGNDQEPAPQTKKASSSEEVRASALRLSSQMALSLRLQLESRSLLEEGYFTNRGQLLRT